ncbi:MAG: hypothetical protein KQ78_00024 [Candidatus Izimaplasma bacterium HR2]|nr:MAG: hypothetical protein KQ78_00024 [Candidatus Izimaplasma bacterium HR2]
MKVLKEFNDRVKCPKCGMNPLFSDAKKWEIMYMKNCNHTSCPWEDDVVLEHIHQTCKECGYEIVSPCRDYNEMKNNQWNTTDTDDDVVADTDVVEPVTPVSQHNVFNPPSRIVSPAVLEWETACSGCPISDTK